jgi:hypothetical protein
LTESELLNHIKTVAVKTIHPEVHRWSFSQVTQNDGEGITRYVGRLKSQAALCNFTVKCSCHTDVSYAEQMVSHRLIAGLANPEHQSRVLSEVQDLPDLKTKIDRLVSLETTDDATNNISPAMHTRSVASKVSGYRKSQRGRSPVKGNPSPGRRSFKKRRFTSPRPGDVNRHNECRGCGKPSHGKEKTMARKDCPAFGKKCHNCGMENHFTTVCERRSRLSHIGTDEEMSAEDTDDDISESSAAGSEGEDIPPTTMLPM